MKAERGRTRQPAWVAGGAQRSHLTAMAGRVKRKAGLAEAAVLATRVVADGPGRCALCGRPLGVRVEWHHVVPKSEGGRDTAPVHPICHRTIHALVGNAELARDYPTLDRLRARDDVARFLRWIAGKPADFHATVRRARREG